MGIDDKINEVLGIESNTKTVTVESKPPVPRGQDAIDGILDIAREGQHPRAYEVAGNLIKNVAETVDKLQDLQKKLKDLKQVPKGANPQIKNALFVGSTAQLQKMLKGQQIDKDESIKSANTEPE